MASMVHADHCQSSFRSSRKGSRSQGGLEVVGGGEENDEEDDDDVIEDRERRHREAEELLTGSRARHRGQAVDRERWPHQATGAGESRSRLRRYARSK